jgi:hypothetical protein
VVSLRAREILLVDVDRVILLNQRLDLLATGV